MKTKQTNKLYPLKAKTIVLLLTLAAMILWNCTINQEDLHPQHNPGDMAQSSPPVEQAFPGEQGELLTGYALLNGELRKITYERINGCNVYEGDILIPDGHIYESRATYESSLNRSIVKITNKWPGGIIPYVIADDVYNEQIIREAIAVWESADIAISFKEEEMPVSPILVMLTRTFLYFMPSDGNSSYVGMVMPGSQPVKLSSKANRGTAIHEIGHALGLEHEHTRADRDNYVIIHWGNIQNGKGHNFEKHADSKHWDIGPFDFGSIMLYSSYSFSNNGLPTITRLNGSTFSAQRISASVGDITGVQVLYGQRSVNYYWNGGHGYANRWGFADIFGNNRDVYVTQRNTGEYYATQMNTNGTVNNWYWTGGHGYANRWAFAEIFGGDRDLYVTHRNTGEFYATLLNSDGTLNNWYWNGGHGYADRWGFAKIFGQGQDIYVTHRNTGEFYATRLNADNTLNNWYWRGHGYADRWGFADIFGNGTEVYVTHRNTGEFYATQLNADGTAHHWYWKGGHGIANRWAFADIFGTGRKVYVTHRNTGEFYATQLNANGTVNNWYWKGGHGFADRWDMADIFGTGQEVYVTHRNNGYFYATQMNANGTLKSWYWGHGHGVAHRWGFADIFGTGSELYVTHRNNGEYYATDLN